MGQQPPGRPVSPVLKALMLGPLAAGAGYTFLALWPAAGSTDTLFAWAMSPVTAVLLGAGYGGAGVMLLLAVRAGSWAEVRVVTAASAVLMVLMLAATLADRGSLHLDGGSLIAFLGAWGWLAVHLAALPIGLVALTAQLLTRGPAPARAPRPPWWVAAPMVSGGLLLAGLGAVLSLRSAALAPTWPWTARPIDVRALGAWALAFGVALLLASREAELRRVRSGMAALVLTGLLGLAGLIRYGAHVAWHQPAAWVAVLVLTALLGLGLCGYGVSAVLDPPRDTDPPRPVELV
ncbi:hypothetical protein AB0K51_24375 [Kitasatospora sp. NPDC049285]|uniref:hypothetical protein n=1 Tax=Kitasatospora sp. NPDC049285 TaxID=3157096 RepID=UPI0034142707